MSTQVVPDSTQLDMFEQVSPVWVWVWVGADLLREVRSSCIYVLSPSGHPPVLLLPGEEPASHVPAVERHFQQVCPQTSAGGAQSSPSHVPRLVS